MFDQIEQRLNETQWLGGQQPSSEDAESYANLNGAKPLINTHPNTFAWYAMVSRFN